MFSGFDFGTSNCAIGVIDQHAENSAVQLLPIDQGAAFMPSALYTLHRDLICESAALQMSDKEMQTQYMQLRKSQLGQARQTRMYEDIRPHEKAIFFGQEAFEEYLKFPMEGFFVKSVKSFLGCSGLHSKTVEFFEDIVTAMMLKIKHNAELALNKSIDHTVIGRPVNFQGVYPDKSNKRALDILTTSAKRAGFKSIEFLYEPLAAGFDFEMGLNKNKTVLVVDIGGGTTDCTMLNMGPDHRSDTERTNDILAYNGDRIGGNDFDIALTGNVLMPLFGMRSNFKDGLPIPEKTFWNAVNTNNIGEQSIFNNKETGFLLDQYRAESENPKLLERFIQLRNDKQNHQLVRSGELAKIALTDNTQHTVDLAYIEDNLAATISQEQLTDAVKHAVQRMAGLLDDVIEQAATQPDLIYITGGSSKSKTIRQTIELKLPGIDIVEGDHFGSVAKGLTVYAQRLFS